MTTGLQDSAAIMASRLSAVTRLLTGCVACAVWRTSLGPLYLAARHHHCRIAKSFAAPRNPNSVASFHQRYTLLARRQANQRGAVFHRKHRFVVFRRGHLTDDF